MNTTATLWWRAAALAVLAALSLALVGCTDTSPTDRPGTEQDDGNDGNDDQNDGNDDRDGDGY